MIYRVEAQSKNGLVDFIVVADNFENAGIRAKKYIDRALTKDYVIVSIDKTTYMDVVNG